MPLAFPSPNLPGVGELQFRDGKRFVPEYLAALMASIDTPRYTYQEAIDLINKGMVTRQIGAKFDQMLKAHFEDEPR